MLDYALFSLWFTVIHIGSYTAAGALALGISGELYRGPDRLLDYLRDMSDDGESNRVGKFFLPAQILRGLLMSVVLYPVMGLLGDISFVLRFLFLAGLMLIYTDVASSDPFPHNIEGFVYMRDKYLKGDQVWKLYVEIVIYSVIFGLLASWLLFR